MGSSLGADSQPRRSELRRNGHGGAPAQAEAARQDHAANVVEAELFHDVPRDDVVRERAHADLCRVCDVPRVQHHETQRALVKALPSHSGMHDAIEDDGGAGRRKEHLAQLRIFASFLTVDHPSVVQQTPSFGARIEVISCGPPPLRFLLVRRLRKLINLRSPIVLEVFKTIPPEKPCISRRRERCQRAQIEAQFETVPQASANGPRQFPWPPARGNKTSLIHGSVVAAREPEEQRLSTSLYRNGPMHPGELARRRFVRLHGILKRSGDRKAETCSILAGNSRHEQKLDP